ncbi:MAG: hypothetical protein ACRDK5_11215 [Solirubrobacterales bacterium]
MPPAEIAIRRLGTATLIAAALALGIAGCTSQEDEETPSACLTEAPAYLQALRAAPGEVRLEGTTQISDCLTPEQDGGELARVGSAMIGAATELNGEALADPGGPATVQLGYLSAAVSRGADSIHTDLARRVTTAAQFSPQGSGALPAEFLRGFGRGYEAGRESG